MMSVDVYDLNADWRRRLNEHSARRSSRVPRRTAAGASEAG
jgi:hypothetical protein